MNECKTFSAAAGRLKILICCLLLAGFTGRLCALEPPPEGAAVNALHYTLDLRFDLEETAVSGTVDFAFRILKATDTLVLHLSEKLDLDAVEAGGGPLLFSRSGDNIQILLPGSWQPGSRHTIRLRYHGQPLIARRPPWDGGFVKSRDSLGNPLLAVACEGEGARLWWPCKDDPADEPDSGVTLIYTVPDSLMAIGNGRLIGSERAGGGRKRYTWRVLNPINLYNVTFYIGDYAHIHDRYAGIRGDSLDLDYYVYRYHEARARRHFGREVPRMLRAFEHYFGPYPFYEDGYKLVETAYLGMEHQSAIAYGNHYLPGYLGYDPSGMGWDYIVVHESGHEWFGNSITAADMSETWIHESFTTYSEALYVEYYAGYEKAQQYLMAQRYRIENREPIVKRGKEDGRAGFSGSDQYYKGAWMLHSIRNIVNDSTKWFALLREMNRVFYHRVVNTEELIAWMDAQLEYPIAGLMRQYLYHKDPPLLELRVQADGRMALRWVADEENFRMPLRFRSGGEWQRMDLGREWTSLPPEVRSENFGVDRQSFYFLTRILE